MASKAHQIDITLQYPPEGRAGSRRWLRRVALAGLKAAVGQSGGVSVDDSYSYGRNSIPGNGPLQVGLVIADDETLRRLNLEYRAADEVTDVLSFAWDHDGHWEGEGEPPESHDQQAPWPAESWPAREHRALGEVIVSYPQAERQALAQGHTAEEELALLIVHGILHLAGFDHMEADQEHRMKAREEEALADIWSEARL